MRLELDFLRRPSRVNVRAAAPLLLGLAAATLPLALALNAHHEVISLRAALARAMPEPVLDARGLRLVSHAAPARRLPWDSLFADIESASDADIGLLAVQPSVADRRVHIAGEARNAEALARYLESLGHARSLGDVYLTQHELRHESGYSVLHFDLTAAWRLS